MSDSQFDLIEGSFDLALRNIEISDSSLMGRKLADDRRVLCASPTYINEYGKPEIVEDLKNHQIISFRDNSPKTLINQSGEKIDIPSNNDKRNVIIDDGLSLKVTTQAGAGISINSLWSVASALEDGSLIRVLPEYVLADQTALWLIYPKSNVLTAKVRVLIDFLIDEIKKPLKRLNHKFA
ncbi:MAG: substrate binding domain-containing protein [Rhizobiaceae bacterium]|nr:substrate binding domain-containing protein [Rhizobiaceae bacterium]